MKIFFQTLKPALISFLCFTVILGLIYPVLIWGIGQTLFSKKANGSLIYSEQGRVVGSELIGQAFITERYFHPRPSFAGVEGYDAAHSSGSNLGPTSKKLSDLMTQRAEEYRRINDLSPLEELPTDAISASASGLDPHISVENAKRQAFRVARAQNLSLDQVKRLIELYTEGGTLEFFGERRVNVLKLNLALDQIQAMGESQ